MGFLFAGHYFFFKKNKEAKSEKNFFKSLLNSCTSTFCSSNTFFEKHAGTPSGIVRMEI